MRISPRHTHSHISTYTGRAAFGASQNGLRGRLMDGPLALPYGYPSCQHSLPLYRVLCETTASTDDPDHSL